MRMRRSLYCVFAAILCSLCAVPEAGAAHHGRAAKAKRTVTTELKRLLAEAQIDEGAYAADRATYSDARAKVRKLTGARRLELSGVLRDLDDMAARGQLTASRAPALFLTLQRNLEYWTTRPLLANGARVTFPPSQIVWQHYAGHGLQIQWLGTFGALNAFAKTKRQDAQSDALLTEALGLASERAGGLAWEYLFPFDGQRPPWVSSLAQGTGLQAMSRAAVRLGRQAEAFPLLHRGLTIFETSPPDGVRIPDGGGAHYLQYSGLPDLKILNGFIQSLVGLYDYAQFTGDADATALFQAGDLAARTEVPAYDTGAWSLYSRGSSSHESDLNYHELLRDFLAQLCARTAAVQYCGAAEHFTAYLSIPPAIQVLPGTLRPNRIGRLRFALSKISRVAVTVSGRTVFSGTLAHGTKSLRWRAPKRTGDYTVTVNATDLAGNPGSATGTVTVAKG
jgi:D-glucuronyl C5-epimerase C-terminus